MLVGDNIYHKDSDAWIQEDSHHSKADGSPEPSNIRNDTSSDSVLASDLFYYFGASAPEVPRELLAGIGYRNGRGYRRIALPQPGGGLIDWLTSNFVANRIFDDPYDFQRGGARYSHATNRLTA